MGKTLDAAVLPYLKAFAAALVAGLMVLDMGLEDGTVTGQEWVRVAVAVLTGGATTWAVPNVTRTKGRYRADG